MGNAIKACFSKYATFSGRASRSEFWFFTLFYAIVYMIGAVFAGVAGNRNLIYLFILPVYLPLLAAEIRRIHDTGRSGWFILVPIYNLVLLLQRGSSSDNKYGPAVN